MRITTELEQINTLEFLDPVVTVIKSHGGQSMAITEPTMVGESSDAGFISSTGDHNEAFPLISFLSTGPLACAPISSSHEQDLQEETSCMKLEPKHKIFLSHSGAQCLLLSSCAKIWNHRTTILFLISGLTACRKERSFPPSSLMPPKNAR